MKLYLHDDGTAPPSNSERGGTHAYTVTCDYEYQVEMWLRDIANDYRDIVRVECPDLGCEWIAHGRGWTKVTLEIRGT